MIHDDKILNLYHYGSIVYGNRKENSDIDYIAIVDKVDKEQYLSNEMDINFYQKDSFNYWLNECKIWAMEVYFLDKKHILKQSYNLTFTLDKEKLRRSIRDQVEKSYVKAKKKLTIEKNQDLIGKKSFWHSIRILLFGIQIATYGKIVDYSAANYLYEDILSLNTWNEIDNKYKALYKSLNREFKNICPIQK